MEMPNSFLLFKRLIVVFIIVSLSGCERDDREAPVKPKPISRLFISTSDYRINTPAYNNMFVVNSSDGEGFTDDRYILRSNTSALGGGTICYGDSVNSIFQASRNDPAYIDTAIYVRSVGTSGVIAGSGRIGNRLFNNVKGLAYSKRRDQLYIANLGQTVSLYAVETPGRKGATGQTVPVSELRFQGFVPWTIQLEGDDLYLAKTGVNGGVGLIRNFVSKMNPSSGGGTVGIDFDYQLSIVGANNIRGMSFVKDKDIMVLTDFSGNGASGRLLIFENFSQYNTSATITPTRIIEGDLTLLKQPISVSVDNRAGKNHVYVADAIARRVFRFDLSQSGNIAPDEILQVGNANDGNAPVSLALFTTTVPE